MIWLCRCCVEVEVSVQLLQRDRLVFDGNDCWLHSDHGTALCYSLALRLDCNVPRMDQLHHVSTQVASPAVILLVFLYLLLLAFHHLVTLSFQA